MSQKQPRIVIVGAGVGGIAFAVNLRKKFPGFENFVIYEKANELGGTWRSNTYPGCSSDVPSHFFSLSTDLNPDWDYTHARQSQFLGYWRSVASKYDLYPHMVFNTMVTSATWNPATSKYRVTTRPVKDDISQVRESGEEALEKVAEDMQGESVDEADIFISALGILEVVRYPNIPGIDTFKGSIFHSGAWDHTVDLQGKRVAVIGNGASATQFVPVISQDPLVQVTNLCRTPNWVLPPIRAEYSPFKKFLFRNVPLVMRLLRFYYWLNTDVFYMLVFGSPLLRSLTRMTLKKYIMDTAPKKYHDKLIPPYTLGCKRVIFDTDYLKCLHRPNVDMNWDGIQSITDDGIITQKGEKLPFDVLIFATGFVADDYPLNVKGARETVKEYYDKNGGPTAYMGTTLPGFPNFFMIAGPNTTTGHTSVIFTEECQIDYMLQLIKPVIHGDVKAVEVTDRATNRYNDKIQNRLRKSVFVDCVSWYRKGSDGKVTSIFPGMASLFWWWFRRVNWNDYRVSADDPNRWERKRRWQAMKRALKNTILMLLVAGAIGAFGAKRAGVWEDVVKEAQRISTPILKDVLGLYQRAVQMVPSRT
ncbi:hypothetical protein V5O48_017008 [Marasmius crinis-equi]|uniref:Monooxygenase n=1 Tax=Marasmius crinis-equi TaxID=585013 RepID=A0ABR3EQ65_9AGAR